MQLRGKNCGGTVQRDAGSVQGIRNTALHSPSSILRESMRIYYIHTVARDGIHRYRDRTSHIIRIAYIAVSVRGEIPKKSGTTRNIFRVSLLS